MALLTAGGDNCRSARARREWKKSKAEGDVLDHKLVRRLLPEYLDEIATVEARKAEIEGQLESAKASDDEADDTDTTGDEDAEEGLGEAEIKALKKELTVVRKRLNEIKAQLIVRLRRPCRAGQWRLSGTRIGVTADGPCCPVDAVCVGTSAGSCECT